MGRFLIWAEAVEETDEAILRLGLPMFVLGEIRVTDGMEKASALARLGPVECELMVFRRKRAA